MSEIVFENKRFVITAQSVQDPIIVAGAPFYAVYFIKNKETGIVEAKTPGLVESIMYAENCDRMLETRPWEWARQTAPEEQQPAFSFGPTN